MSKSESKAYEPGRFSFEAIIEKGYTDPNGGLHVLAIPSDTLRDDQGDSLTKRCLDRMASQCRQGIDILDNHRSTFGFGVTTKDTTVRPMAGMDGEYQLAVDILLDPTYPQARALFNEVMTNRCRKQLSIGGKLNRENPNCVK